MNTRMLAAAMAVALAATPALADNGKGKSNRGAKSDGHAQASCPPGLAKKNPPCVPPGLVRNTDGYGDYRDIRIGDIIDDRFAPIEDPLLYGLSRDYFYYRALDSIFRVDPETRQVLAFIGLVDALLN